MNAASDQMIPRLDLRLPVTAGIVAMIAFLGVSVSGAAYTPVEKGVSTPGKIVSDGKAKAVVHHRTGAISEINVADGQHVSMGDVLITLDTQALQEQIAALQAQSEAAARQFELVRAEAATVANLIERNLAPKSRLQQAEQQLQDVSKEAAGLASRIALVQAEIDKSALRAPVAGQVVGLADLSRGSQVQEGAAALEIAPDDEHIVVESRLTVDQAADLKPGVAASVWLRASGWQDQRPLPAKLSWISASSTDDNRTGQPYVLVRVELEGSRADLTKSLKLHAGTQVEILLVTGQESLLSELINPFMRRVHKALQS